MNQQQTIQLNAPNYKHSFLCAVIQMMMAVDVLETHVLISTPFVGDAHFKSFTNELFQICQSFSPQWLPINDDTRFGVAL